MLWLKGFHIIAMVAWFAGIFYLPRLFVYHSNLEKEDRTTDALFATMERRLFWGIMTPSAVITVLLGLGLMHTMGYTHYLPLWFVLKLALVALLIIFHCYCGFQLKRFQRGTNTHSALFYRWINELPVFLLIGIVLLVVLKPWLG